MSTDDLAEALRIAGQARSFTGPSSRERALVVLADEVDRLRAEADSKARDGRLRLRAMTAERDAARAALERVRA
ncbi:hypothetical protein ACFWFR_00940 [Oerskovia sp. NPDC060287]|uniref:hypothetical protein n=1 Tax=Oerskovia sp. NPDC060287 TaxID=3347095 RepID=UPI003669CA9D